MSTPHLTAALAAWLRRNHLPLLAAAYVGAAVAPAPGLWLRGQTLGTVAAPGARVPIAASAGLLALLFFVVGLGVDTGRLRGLARNPRFLVAGVAACLVVPLLIAALLAVPLAAVAGPVGGAIAAGLVVIAVMPVASASAVCGARAGGDAALGIGLILVTTVLSAAAASLQLAVAARFVGDLPAAWQRGIGRGPAALLVAVALLPAGAGMAVRAAVGARAVERARPHTTLTSGVCLLLLGYSSAALVLPRLVDQTQWAVLVLAAVAVGVFCAARFVAGWYTARLVRGDHPTAVALTFGVGMSNTGAGLVLVSAAAPHEPLILLPILLYTFAQHLAAGVMEEAHSAPVGDPVPEPTGARPATQIGTGAC